MIPKTVALSAIRFGLRLALRDIERIRRGSPPVGMVKGGRHVPWMVLAREAYAHGMFRANRHG